MITTVLRFVRNDEGATAIEYGLIAGIVSVAIVVGLGLVSGALDTTWTAIVTGLTPAP